MNLSYLSYGDRNRQYSINTFASSRCRHLPGVSLEGRRGYQQSFGLEIVISTRSPTTALRTTSSSTSWTTQQVSSWIFNLIVLSTSSRKQLAKQSNIWTTSTDTDKRHRNHLGGYIVDLYTLKLLDCSPTSRQTSQKTTFLSGNFKHL